MANVFKYPGFERDESFFCSPSIALASAIIGFDKAAAEQFEKLNPVLSNGHRLNPITVILDNSVPKEVSQVLVQFIQQQPKGTDFGNLSDEELLSVLPSRYAQSQPELDLVRDALLVYASRQGVGEAAVQAAVQQAAAADSSASVDSSVSTVSTDSKSVE